MKKVLSVILALVMVLTMIPVGTLTASAEENGDYTGAAVTSADVIAENTTGVPQPAENPKDDPAAKPANAVTDSSFRVLELDTEYTVVIDEENASETFSFTPSISGTYVYYSEGGYDTYGCLYDSYGNQLIYNDDGDIDLNFCVLYSLTAGTTYLYEARMLSSETYGSFSVLLQKLVEVESIAVTKLPDQSTVNENLDGYWTTRWDEAAQEDVPFFYYEYSIYGMELTVNYTDGTSEAFTYDDSNYGYFNGYQMGYSVDQNASPWTLGGNAVAVTYRGAQTSFDFTVIESPVAGITVTKLPDKSTFNENLDGYWTTRWDEAAQEYVEYYYYYYSIYGMELTVNYTDGTSEAFTYDSGNDGYFNGYQMGCSVDQNTSPWMLGGNAVTVTYMGAQTSFDFTVIESPVAGITVTKLPDKSTFNENLDGYWTTRWDEAAQEYVEYYYYYYSIYGMELTVNYTDGTSEAFTYDSPAMTAILTVIRWVGPSIRRALRGHSAEMR